MSNDGLVLQDTQTVMGFFTKVSLMHPVAMLKLNEILRFPSTERPVALVKMLGLFVKQDASLRALAVSCDVVSALRRLNAARAASGVVDAPMTSVALVEPDAAVPEDFADCLGIAPTSQTMVLRHV